jgi:hypothetical protein
MWDIGDGEVKFFGMWMPDALLFFDFVLDIVD